MQYANEIIPNLWLGCRNSPLERENLRKNNIKLIINCSKDLDYPVDSDIQTIRLAINDANTEESNSIINDNIDTITYIMDTYLNNNIGVLVHCFAGMQRSATVVICYLIKYKHMKMDIAKQLMKSKRSIVFLPYPTFDTFITNYSLKYL
jgi:protein-tyrosine phosphatase